MIELWDNLVVEADERQYIVGEYRTRTVKKDGTTVEEKYIYHPAYCVTLSQALQEAFERSVRKISREEQISLKQIVQRVESIYKKQRELMGSVSE